MAPANSLKAILNLTVWALLIGMSNCGAAGNSDPRLYGTWDLFEVQGNGMTAQVRLTIEKDRLANSSLCSFADKQVTVRTISSAVITRDEIVILEDSEAQREFEPGFLNCRVSVDQGTLRYRLVDDNLVLHVVGHDQTVELSRSGGPFTQARQLAGVKANTP